MANFEFKYAFPEVERKRRERECEGIQYQFISYFLKDQILNHRLIVEMINILRHFSPILSVTFGYFSFRFENF